MTHCGLAYITPEVGRFTGLKKINLAGNALKVLPESLGSCRELTHISVERNLLVSIPESISKLTKLEHLILSFNMLQTLPEGISQLCNLEHLKVDHNSLKELPTDIGRLDKLTVLAVNHNNLKYLPGSIARMVSLAAFTFRKNQLYRDRKLMARMERHSLPTLKELAARFLIRHGIDYEHENLPSSSKEYLRTAKQCDFCKGPYFEAETRRCRFYKRGQHQLTTVYKLCCNHWNDEKDFRVIMFRCPGPSTRPRALPSGQRHLTRRPQSSSGWDTDTSSRATSGRDTPVSAHTPRNTITDTNTNTNPSCPEEQPARTRTARTPCEHVCNGSHSQQRCSSEIVQTGGHTVPILEMPQDVLTKFEDEQNNGAN